MAKYIGPDPSPKNTQANRFSFTATAGQTIFTNAQLAYKPGYVDVFINGSKQLGGTDYTAVDGTTVTLTAGATLGDIVEIEAYKDLSILDLYSKSQVDTLISQHPLFAENAAIGGTANAITATYTSSLVALYNGLQVRARIATQVTSSTPTLEVILGSTSTGVKSIKDKNGNLVDPRYLPAGFEALFSYDGTNWRLQNYAVGTWKGLKNYLINGGMDIAQRGTTYALTTTLSYGSLDRWAANMSTSAAGIFNQVAGSNGFKNYAKLGRNSGSALTNSIGINQALETVNSIPLQGKIVTLSFYALAGANFSGASSQMRVFLQTGTGTDQSVASYGSWTGVNVLLNTTQTITTTLTRYQFSVTIPSNATQVGISLFYTPTGTAGADDNVYITGVQLEEGPVATDFDFRPFGFELSLCQRYYEKSYDVPVALGTNTTVGSLYATGRVNSATSVDPGPYVQFKVTKRTATPTITTWTESGTINQFGFNATSLASTTSRVGSYGFNIYTTAASGLTIGQCVQCSGHWAADAEL